MPREASLPPIFSQYAHLVRYVQRVSDKEYSSTCPKCGGELHPNNEWPDRCRWFVDATPLGWCRRCGTIFWPDKADGYTPPTPQEIGEWKKRQEQIEEERRRSAERALANLRSGRVWEQYHERMGAIGREWWRNRGIPDSLQDFWQLGYCTGRRFSISGTDYERDVATIPIFDVDGKIINIKNRIIDPPDGIGKYRYEIAIGSAPLFLADYSLPLDGSVIAVEGEIKAMNVWFTLGAATQQVVGFPGLSAVASLAALKKAEKVSLVVDPGGKKQGIMLAKSIGVDKTWLVETPVKIDDAIIKLHLGSKDIARLLAGAVRVGDFVKGG